MSKREAEVLDAVRDGLTNAQIGRRLPISVRTVESHVSSLLRKLGAAGWRAIGARFERAWTLLLDALDCPPPRLAPTGPG